MGEGGGCGWRRLVACAGCACASGFDDLSCSCITASARSDGSFLIMFSTTSLVRAPPIEAGTRAPAVTSGER